MSEDGSGSELILSRPYGHHNTDGFIKNFNEYIPCHPVTEYKISQPPSMEAQLRKLRIAMDNWKHVILQINDVLLWEKHWHPSAIIGGSTILFTLLWLCDPNILTIISLLGLLITICDYVVPSLASSWYKAEITEDQQKQYEAICTNIIISKAKAELLFTSYYKMRVTNPKLYFTITIISLSVLAWIGGTFNNLFLVYLLVTFILMFPGLDHNGMLDKWTSAFSKIFNELVANAKSKVGQNKKIQ